MAKRTDKTEENIQAVEQALGKTEQFIEDNQKIILIALGAIVFVILAYFGFQRFYIAPKEKNAAAQMFMAEKYFEMDSLNLALNGDGINPGFLNIISDYKLTKSSNLSKYYAGVIYMQKGEFEKAIDYLEDFDGSDQILEPMASGAMGDCYVELGNLNKAVSNYLDAADKSKNEFSTPLFLQKAGWAYELLKDYKNAVLVYKRIKTEFPKSNEAREMDKYIARAEGFLKK